MTTFDKLAAALLENSDRRDRVSRLSAELQVFDPETTGLFIEELRKKLIATLRSDVHLALRIAEIVSDIAEITGDENHRAMAYRLLAQTHLIGFMDIETALEEYQQAIALYQNSGNVLGHAKTSSTYVWALAISGDYDAAVKEGNWAAAVLKQEKALRSQASLQNNLAMIHLRAGKLIEALHLLDDSWRIYQSLGAEGREYLTNNAINRALVLCDLGRFDESIAASREARKLAGELQQDLLRTRSDHNLGLTYMILGRYNRALQFLDSARGDWVKADLPQEVHQCDLASTYCLLQLQRYEEVLQKCADIRAFYLDKGAGLELAQSYLNEAQAYEGLGQIKSALDSLEKGKKIFLEQENLYWTCRADLITAALFARQGRYAESRQLAEACAVQFSDLDYPVDEAGASLQAGKAALAMGDYVGAERAARKGLSNSEARGLGALNYLAYYLLGRSAAAQARLDAAGDHYDRAIRELGKLQGQMMVEHRPDFMIGEDKRLLFESAVDLALSRGEAQRGLRIVEKAKSRALLDILKHRLDLRVQPRRPADKNLVDRLNRLMGERNTLYRIQTRSFPGQSFPADAPETARALEIENEIQSLRQKLLVRQADYAGQFDENEFDDVPVLSGLPARSAVLEYFFLQEKVIAFLVRMDGGNPVVSMYPLGATRGEIQKLLLSLQTNFAAAAYRGPDHAGSLVQHAKKVLARLYDLLLDPMAGELKQAKQLFIVPYGLLHYLPFHACYNGSRYLIETHGVSYLPGISFLSQKAAPVKAGARVLLAGHSYDERLPFAIEEAEKLASFIGVAPLLEEQASLAAVRKVLPECALFHCAAHGVFRADNPLFSGIALADGWLTMLDIFNLKIQAALVVLSACSTGQNVIGGGDELFGFMRAFLAAGAGSLLLSLWEVNDASTSELMLHFYRELRAGKSRVDALQAAQRAFLETDKNAYSHPFFWAPFYLVGETGSLAMPEFLPG